MSDPNKHLERIYEDHQLMLTREALASGELVVFYSIYRLSSLTHCLSGVLKSEETLAGIAHLLECQIDLELMSLYPWGK